MLPDKSCKQQTGAKPLTKANAPVGTQERVPAGKENKAKLVSSAQAGGSSHRSSPEGDVLLKYAQLTLQPVVQPFQKQPRPTPGSRPASRQSQPGRGCLEPGARSATDNKGRHASRAPQGGHARPQSRQLAQLAFCKTTASTSEEVQQHAILESSHCLSLPEAVHTPQKPLMPSTSRLCTPAASASVRAEAGIGSPMVISPAVTQQLQHLSPEKEASASGSTVQLYPSAASLRMPSPEAMLCSPASRCLPASGMGPPLL